jgi:hypothetical protein
MKVIIAGSRTILDDEILYKAITQCQFKITEVVCGCAKGVDTSGKEWAEANNIPCKLMPADWYRSNGSFDISAGYARNESMGDYADAAICIYDGVSKGTWHMIGYMRKLHKPVFVYLANRVDLFKFGE